MIGRLGMIMLDEGERKGEKKGVHWKKCCSKNKSNNNETLVLSL